MAVRSNCRSGDAKRESARMASGSDARCERRGREKEDMVERRWDGLKSLGVESEVR